MLFIKFRPTCREYNRLIDIYFKFNFKPSWLEDNIVKAMIKDVDKSDVLGPYCIQSPVLGQIPPVSLSTGVKGLILARVVPDFKLWATACGDNCAKWILELAESRDLHIGLDHFMQFDKSTRFNAICENNGHIIRTYADYVREWLDAEDSYRNRK